MISTRKKGHWVEKQTLLQTLCHFWKNSTLTQHLPPGKKKTNPQTKSNQTVIDSSLNSFTANFTYACIKTWILSSSQTSLNSSAPLYWFWGKRGTLTLCHGTSKTSMKQNHPRRYLISLMLNKSLPCYSLSTSHSKFLRAITLPLLILSCPFLVKYLAENNWNLMMLQRSLHMTEWYNRKCYVWDYTFFSQDP